MTDRAEYIEGLRLLADRLEDNEAVALPVNGDTLPISLWLYGGDAVQEAVKLLDSATDPEWVSSRLDYLLIRGRFAGLKVHMVLPGEACQKRVAGVYKASDGSIHEVTERVLPPELADLIAAKSVSSPSQDGGKEE